MFRRTVPVGCIVMHPVGQRVTAGRGAVIVMKHAGAGRLCVEPFYTRLRIDSLSLGYC
jgi:hypothetical protein